MHVQAFHAPDMGKWWFLVSNHNGEPIVVSPAIYPSFGAALVAGNAEVGGINRVISRRLEAMNEEGNHHAQA